MSSKGKSSAETSGGSALVPRLRFPEFQNTEGWKPERLGRFLSESRLPGSKGDVARKITVKLWGGGVLPKNETIQGSANTQYFQRKSGQLIYSKLDFLNQAFGIIPDHLDGYESTADLPCFDISADLNSAFILEYVKRKEFYLRVGETADGSRIAKRIHPETFLAVEIPLPSLPEQNKIADCLDSADALIAAQGRKVEALKAHKKGLMQQLFSQEGETQPRLRFPEFKGAGDWQVRAVGDVFRVTRGEVLSMTLVSDMPTEEACYPVYSSQTKNVGLAGYYSRFLYQDAITWTTDGANAGDVNFRRGKFFCTNVCGVLISKDGHANACVAALLNSVTRNHVSYVGNPKLMNGVMAGIEIPFPSVPEQQRIADCLTSLDNLIAAETRKLDTLKTHKKGLMQQLFPVVGEDDA